MDRELDARVARAMGWTDVRWEEDRAMIAGGVLKGYNPKSTYAWCLVPYYRTDIAVAWQLVDRLNADGYWLVMKITPDKNHFVTFSSNDYVFDGYGKVAPEAICRAFLAAMEA